MADLLEIRYIPLDEVVLWDENPKLHDIGGIIQSIQKYGFIDEPKFDPSINSGRGGLVLGNGRIHCLKIMRDSGYDVPRGLKPNWDTPVRFGVNAKSEEEAIQLAIDHNNLPLSGGDLTGIDMSKMYSPDYADLAHNTITVPDEVIIALKKEEEPIQDFLDTMTRIVVQVPADKKEEVKAWLKNGQHTMGAGLLKRMGESECICRD